jgi:hypothetical protein
MSDTILLFVLFVFVKLKWEKIMLCRMDLDNTIIPKNRD